MVYVSETTLKIAKKFRFVSHISASPRACCLNSTSDPAVKFYWNTATLFHFTFRIPTSLRLLHVTAGSARSCRSSTLPWVGVYAFLFHSIAVNIRFSLTYIFYISSKCKMHFVLSGFCILGKGWGVHNTVCMKLHQGRDHRCLFGGNAFSKTFPKLRSFFFGIKRR